MTPILFRSLARAAVALTLWSSMSSPALADLALFPTRVVLENKQRAAQVELMNTGTQPETYRISLVNRRMGEHGEFIAADQPGPGENFANDLVRYSPRQVTIQPGSSQTVRILLRKPAELEAGEYRSHLQFDRVPDAAAASIESLNGAGEKQVGVVVQVLVGASIPIIVRHGQTGADVSLSDLQLLSSGTDQVALGFHINRSGNRSVYGDLRVSFVPRQGKAVDLAQADGVAVYVPNAVRRARIPLRLPPALRLADGTLHVLYRERTEAGGGVLAQTQLQLP